MAHTRPSHMPAWPLALLIALYLALGALYAVQTPTWQVPDEPAHYNYIRYLAERRTLPVLQPGDYPLGYLEEIKGAKFPPEMSIDPIRYEFYQPPLYYLLMVPIYLATGGLPLAQQVVALRLVSLLFGAGVVALAYVTARATLSPGREEAPAEVRGASTTEISPDLLAFGVAAFIVMLPMHLTMMAATNNDGLAELVLAGVLYLAVRVVQRGGDVRHWTALGALVGIALLTKGTTYIALPLALVAAFWGQRHSARRRPWRPLVWVCGVAALVAGGWFLRNAAVYGWHDPLAWQRHTAVVSGQLTRAAYIAQYGSLTWAREFICTTFHSFWGQFGWMAVPMDQRVYLALYLLCGLVTLGLALWVVRRWRERSARESAAQWRALGIMALSLALSVAQYLWLNRQLVQFQGRYLNSSLIPLALAFTVGWAELWRHEYAGWLTGALGAGMVLLLGKGIVTGDPDKVALALLTTATLAFAVRRFLSDRTRPLLYLLLYPILLALACATPFLFIAPYL